MKSRKLSITTRYVLLFGILLFIANTVLGLIILNQSREAMRELVQKDMLDVVKSAAGTLDGDALEALTEDDVDGPVFTGIEDQLLVFQNSVDIHFIYAVKQVGDEEFVFTVDPDPVDPGAFGEEVLTTPALVSAATGVPTVDSSPAEDRWGNFYSAYSPVFNSKGEVAGIIGIDFDAEWYDAQIQKYSVSIAVVTSLSVVLGALVVLLITNGVRKRFRDLDNGLSELSDNVDTLMDEMAAYSGFEVPDDQRNDLAEKESSSDELEVLSDKIHVMQAEMSAYVDYLRAQAYTDALTKVANAAAYHQAIDAMNEKIADGSAIFCVAVFDLNSLKELNDTYGHEYGDLYIQAAASAIAHSFGDERTYRIGGDEFAVIAENVDSEQMEQKLCDVMSMVESINEEERPCPAKLALSRGMAVYEADNDVSYIEVFARADHEMYEDKSLYYRTVGDRRGRGPRN